MSQPFFCSDWKPIAQAPNTGVPVLVVAYPDLARYREVQRWKFSSTHGKWIPADKAVTKRALKNQPRLFMSLPPVPELPVVGEFPA